MVYSKKYKNPQAEAIITTIIYSDLFNFPLTKAELWKFLISERKINRRDFEIILQELKEKYITEKDGYFSLKKKEKIIERRKENQQEVENKLKIAVKAAYYLSYISSILFIGISGGLAMGDVDKADDIDFFVITKKNSIFKSRFLILCMLQMLNIRRKRQDLNPTDKICVNYMIDSKSLTFYDERRDLYTAHEILQIVPLYDKKDTFQKFVMSNEWVSNFFPNAKDVGKKAKLEQKKSFILTFIFYILNTVLSEGLCRHLQMILINKHKKNEIVTNHVLAFNPNDYRVRTLRELRLRLHELGLLTKY